MTKIPEDYRQEPFKDENGLIQLTDEIPPDKFMDTQHGKLTGSDWLYLEKHRIESKGATCEIKETNGNLTLWVTPIPMPSSQF